MFKKSRSIFSITREAENDDAGFPKLEGAEDEKDEKEPEEGKEPDNKEPKEEPKKEDDKPEEKKDDNKEEDKKDDEEPKQDEKPKEEEKKDPSSTGDDVKDALEEPGTPKGVPSASKPDNSASAEPKDVPKSEKEGEQEEVVPEQTIDEDKQRAENSVNPQEIKPGALLNAQCPTIIISAFPCCGKSTYANMHDDSIDLESSHYSKKVDGTPNPEFPGNYVNIIKYHLVNNNWKYMFVSSHKIVRDALKADGIKFYSLYPVKERKLEIIELCKKRGNTEQFIKILEENFDQWIDEMSQEPLSYGLGANEFISDDLFNGKLKFLKR